MQGGVPALLVALLFYCTQASATELAPNAEVQRRIRALAPNQAVNLGLARVLGDFNEVARRFELDRTGPRARDYSLKMVWAPERRRALFLGANHGRPHRLNDVWEFDLAAMAWLLLYAPDNPRNYADLGRDASDVVFEGGVLVTHRGGPAIIAHTWSGVTYDPIRRQVLFMNTWPIKQDELIRGRGGDPKQRYAGPPLWSFSPESRTWSVHRVNAEAPRAPVGGMLEYVPELGGAIWHMNNWQMRSTWLYEPDKTRWQKLAVATKKNDFEQSAPSRELVGYHDPVRQLVIARQGRGTFHFDTRRRVWEKVDETPADAAVVPDGHDARNVFYHDPGSGHGLLVDFSSQSIWSYDPDRAAWHQQVPVGDPMPAGKRMLAYLDHEYGVLVVIEDRGVWAYRYR